MKYPEQVIVAIKHQNSQFLILQGCFPWQTWLWVICAVPRSSGGAANLEFQGDLFMQGGFFVGFFPQMEPNSLHCYQGGLISWLHLTVCWMLQLGEINSSGTPLLIPALQENKYRS